MTGSQRPDDPNTYGYVDFREEIREWEALVGKAILHFGEIELMTYFCLRSLPTERIFDSVADLAFGRRVAIILDLLAAKPDATRDRLALLLIKSKRLAGTRNLIAHNPMQLSVYQYEDTQAFHLQGEISSPVKENQKLDRKGLERYVHEVEALRTEISEAARAVFAYQLADPPTGSESHG